MNTEPETLSTEELPEVPGIVRVKAFVSLRKEVFEYLDKCFQLMGQTWDSFIQEEIDNSLEMLREGSSSWLGEGIQDNFKKI